jgi:hypothetical protein
VAGDEIILDPNEDIIIIVEVAAHTRILVFQRWRIIFCREAVEIDIYPELQDPVGKIYLFLFYPFLKINAKDPNQDS